MRNATADPMTKRAEILAEALSDTIAELRLIEAGDMIAYIRTSRWANIADLVQSSTELYFEEGTLSFACSAEFQVSWANPASISLDMEFQGNGVAAFFTLTLAPQVSLVDIKTIWFSGMPLSEEAGTRLFQRAIAEARLPPPAAPPARDHHLQPR